MGIKAVNKILAVFLSVGMFMSNISAQNVDYVMDKKLKQSIDTFIAEQENKMPELDDITVEVETYKLPEYQNEPVVSESTYIHNPVKYIAENSDSLPTDSDYYITSHANEISDDYKKAHAWLTNAIATTSTNRELEYKLVIKHLQDEFKYVSSNKIAEILATNKLNAKETRNISNLLLEKFNHEEFAYPSPDDVGKNVFYISALMSNPNAQGIDGVINAIFDVLYFGNLDSKLEAVQSLMLAEFGDDKKTEIAARVKKAMVVYNRLQYEKNQSFLQELGLSNTSYTTNQRQAHFFLVWNLDKALTKIDWLVMGQTWEKKPGENQVDGAGWYGEDDSMQYSESGLKHYILKYLVMTFVKNSSQSEINDFIDEYISVRKLGDNLYEFNHYILTAWYGLEALNVFSEEDLDIIKDSMKEKLKSNLKLVIGTREYNYIARECWAKFGVTFLIEDIIIEGLLFPVIGIIRINKGFRAIGKLTFRIGQKIMGPKLMKVWHTNKIFRRAARQNKWGSNKIKQIEVSVQQITDFIKKQGHAFNYAKPFSNNFNAFKGYGIVKSTKNKMFLTRALNSFWRDVAKVKTIRAGKYRVPYQTKELFDTFLKTADELGLKFNVAEQNMIDIIAREHAEMATKKLGTYAIATRAVWVPAVLSTPILLLELFDTRPYEVIENLEEGLDGVRNNEDFKIFIEGLDEEEIEETEITDILDNYLEK